jgi:glycerate 2-kinase
MKSNPKFINYMANTLCMKVLICPDSFKGTYSASEIANFIAQGVKLADSKCEITKVPMTDGGDGTIDTLNSLMGGELIKVKVHGPLGKETLAKYLIIDQGRTAIIEMAEAAGINLLQPRDLNPMKTTTFGVGQLINDALDHGVKKILVCIGGSATNDAGIGMAQALGIKFFNNLGEIEFRKKEGYSGGSLQGLARINTSLINKKIHNTKFIVLCDVVNPLHGSNGAAYIYAPQKGASLIMAKELDSLLVNFEKIVKKCLGRSINIPGAGAAGGLGAGLVAFLNAELKPGIDTIIEITGLEDKIKMSDLVITGEGCLDSQSLNNKAVIGIAKIANSHKVPVVAINGCHGKGYQDCNKYFTECVNISDNKPQNIKMTHELIKSKVSLMIQNFKKDGQT